MPSLKDLKLRIDSVKSTQKITSAMKMVAASKLRRAQEQAEAGRPYAERMGRMLSALATNMLAGGAISADAPRLIAGTGSDKTHLLVVLSSDRGLCGGFNGNLVREAKRQIHRLQSEGKTVKLICVGRKGRDLLRRDHASLIVKSYEDVGRRRLSFAEAAVIAEQVLSQFDAGEFDVAHLVYNKFKSAITQVITIQQIIPFAPAASTDATAGQAQGGQVQAPAALTEFEPSEEQILADLLPRNLSIQVYSALLESAASEQGARMTAMDNATRNAGDMIKKLTLIYNRTRQSVITKELIEIISGAEAV